MDTGTFQDGKIKDIKMSVHNNSQVYYNSTQNTIELKKAQQKNSEVHLDE